MGVLSGRWPKLLAAAAVVLLLVQPLGQPFLLSYVETDSMEPTLEPGDGFVAVPAAVAGEPKPGDVVVYRSEVLNPGGLTTHRVVGETDRGYVTRGDGNPFTDQSAGEPPVRRADIVAVGLQVGGELVVLPELGTGREVVGGAVTAITSRLGLGDASRSVWVGTAVALAVVLLFTGSRRRRERTPTESRGRGRAAAPSSGARTVVLLAGVLVVSLATASMVLPLGPTEYQVVSAESDAPGPGVIPAGEEERATYRMAGGGVVPTRYYVTPAGEGVAVENGTRTVEPGGSANASVVLSAPPELGSYSRYVTEHRYPLVLPLPVIDTLYRLHPVAPVIVIDSLVALPFLLLARLAGTRRRSLGSPGASSGLLSRGRP